MLQYLWWLEQRKFSAHLENATRIVDSWPEWKQNMFGQIGKKLVTYKSIPAPVELLRAGRQLMLEQQARQDADKN